MWDTEEDMLLEHEGLRITPYQDSEGYWTIGVGHLMVDGYQDTTWSYEHCIDVLRNDIARCVHDLRVRLPWYDDLEEPRRWALLDMCFNLGVNKLMRFKKMLSAIEVGDYEEASAQALDSKWAKQVKGRATQVAEMIRTGEFPWTQSQS